MADTPARLLERLAISVFFDTKALKSQAATMQTEVSAALGGAAGSAAVAMKNNTDAAQTAMTTMAATARTQTQAVSDATAKMNGSVTRDIKKVRGEFNLLHAAIGALATVTGIKAIIEQSEELKQKAEGVSKAWTDVAKAAGESGGLMNDIIGSSQGGMTWLLQGAILKLRELNAEWRDFKKLLTDPAGWFADMGERFKRQQEANAKEIAGWFKPLTDAIAGQKPAMRAATEKALSGVTEAVTSFKVPETGQLISLRGTIGDEKTRAEFNAAMDRYEKSVGRVAKFNDTLATSANNASKSLSDLRQSAMDNLRALTDIFNQYAGGERSKPDGGQAFGGQQVIKAGFDVPWLGPNNNGPSGPLGKAVQSIIDQLQRLIDYIRRWDESMGKLRGTAGKALSQALDFGSVDLKPLKDVVASLADATALKPEQIAGIKDIAHAIAEIGEALADLSGRALPITAFRKLIEAVIELDTSIARVPATDESGTNKLIGVLNDVQEFVKFIMRDLPSGQIMKQKAADLALLANGVSYFEHLVSNIMMTPLAGGKFEEVFANFTPGNDNDMRAWLLRLDAQSKMVEANLTVMTKIVEGMVKIANAISQAPDSQTWPQKFQTFAQGLLALDPVLTAYQAIGAKLQSGINRLVAAAKNVPTVVAGQLSQAAQALGQLASAIQSAALGNFPPAALTLVNAFHGLGTLLKELGKLDADPIGARVQEVAISVSIGALNGIVSGLANLANMADLSGSVEATANAADNLEMIADNMNRMWRAIGDIFTGKPSGGSPGKTPTGGAEAGSKGLVTEAQKTYEGVVGWFQKMFDDLVGHSIVPDMIKAIEANFKRLREVVHPVEEMQGQVAGVMDALSSNFTSAIENFTRTGKLSVKDMVRSIIADLQTLAMQTFIINPIKKGIGNLLGSIFGAFGGSRGGGSMGTAASIFSSFGGAHRAMGGPVLAGMPYLIGERGPELFVPGSSGGIIANDNLRGSRGNVINININLTGARGDREIARIAEAAAMQGIAKAAPALVGASVRAVRTNARNSGTG